MWQFGAERLRYRYLPAGAVTVCAHLDIAVIKHRAEKSKSFFIRLFVKMMLSNCYTT
jgi:hypothetical protein